MKAKYTTSDATRERNKRLAEKNRNGHKQVTCAVRRELRDWCNIQFGSVNGAIIALREMTEGGAK